MRRVKLVMSKSHFENDSNGLARFLTFIVLDLPILGTSLWGLCPIVDCEVHQYYTSGIDTRGDQ